MWRVAGVGNMGWFTCGKRGLSVVYGGINCCSKGLLGTGREAVREGWGNFFRQKSCRVVKKNVFLHFVAVAK